MRMIMHEDDQGEGRQRKIAIKDEDDEGRG